MTGRSLTVALLVLVAVLLLLPLLVVSFIYLSTSEHFVYSLLGGFVLLVALIIAWRRFRLP